MTTATKTSALDELAALDEVETNLARRKQELEDQLRVIGQRGRPQNVELRLPAQRGSGKIGAVIGQVVTLQGQAARAGEPADVSKLEAEIAALEEQADKLREEIKAIQREELRVPHERLDLRRRRFAEFAGHADDIDAAGHPLIDDAVRALRALVQHRRRVAEAVALAAGGAADEQTRKQLVQRHAPWVGSTSELASLWRGIASVESALATASTVLS